MRAASRNVRCTLSRTPPRRPVSPSFAASRAAGGGTADTRAVEIPWKKVTVLTGSQFIVNSGFGFIIPILPVFAKELGMGASGVGLILSLPSITRIISNKWLGEVADTWGRKPPMVAGTILMSISAAGTGLATSFATVAPFRLLLGFGAAASTAGSQAYMADLTSAAPQHRAKLMGLQQTAITAAFVAGPVMGGVLTEHFGVRPAFFCSAIASLACCAGYASLRETLQNGKRPQWLGNSVVGGVTPKKSLLDRAPSVENVHSGAPSAAEGKAEAAGEAEAARQTVRARLQSDDSIEENAAQPPLTWIEMMKGNPSLTAAAAMNFSLFFGYSSLLTVLPLHASALWSATPGQIGLLFGGMSSLGFACTPAGGWAADRFGRKAAIVPSSLFIAMGAGAMALVGQIDAVEIITGMGVYPQFLGAALLWGAGNSLITPGLTAYAVDLAPEAQKGSVLSLMRQAGDIAFLVGPIGLGLLAEATSYPVALGFTSAVMTSTSVLFSYMADSNRTHPSA